MDKKTDNGFLNLKLDLRRHFLRAYHANGDARVLDCCQGSGMIWTPLRNEFPIASYWGLDIKPQKGRLRLASQQVLAQPGWNQNVIDIDTYGSPWEHWSVMLANATFPITCFLTVGRRGVNGKTASPTNLSKSDVAMLGIENLIRASSTGIMALLFRNAHEYLASLALAMACDRCKIVECVEAVSPSLTRYIGIRLESKTAATEIEAPQRPKHRKSAKETSHV